jgi:hypothetical protein
MKPLLPCRRESQHLFTCKQERQPFSIPLAHVSRLSLSLSLSVSLSLALARARSLSLSFVSQDRFNSSDHSLHSSLPSSHVPVCLLTPHQLTGCCATLHSAACLRRDRSTSLPPSFSLSLPHPPETSISAVSPKPLTPGATKGREFI